MNSPFYRVAPHACMAGTHDIGTSPLPGLMQMVAMGWLVWKAEIAYAATMTTTCCNLVKNGGGSGHVARKYLNTWDS